MIALLVFLLGWFALGALVTVLVIWPACVVASKTGVHSDERY